MVALVLATLALVIATVVVVIGVRSRKASEVVLQRGLTEMRGQIDLLAGELTRAVTEAQENATRARIVESLGQAVDPDKVLARCVEAALSLPRVSGAVVYVEVDGSSIRPPRDSTQRRPIRSPGRRTEGTSARSDSRITIPRGAGRTRVYDPPSPCRSSSVGDRSAS